MTQLLSTNAPIGVFDSGLGGLTVVQAIERLLPGEDILYFGDTRYVPYGDKPREVLRSRARATMQWFVSQGVKAVVVACNTSVANSYDVILEVAGDLPVVEVVSPTVEAALVGASDVDTIHVIATRATVSAGMYTDRLTRQRPGIQVIERATPLLAPVVEAGVATGQYDRAAIQQSFDDPTLLAASVLVLGCTHYPYLQEEIRRIYLVHARPVPTMICSEAPTALALQKVLTDRGLVRQGTDHSVSLHVSKLTADFQLSAERFLGRPLSLRQQTF